jgi:CBS domain containing-hemolysin-like protein
MLISIVVLCTLCEAIFTSLEVALGAVSRARLRSLIEGEQAAGQSRSLAASRATRVLRILDRPDRLALAFITVTSLSLWTAATLLTWYALIGDWPLWTLPLELTGVLFLAEVLPLLVAANHPETVALRGIGLAEFSLTVLSPLLHIIGGLGYGTARILGAGPGVSPHVTEGELRSALATAEEEGVIESDERALLEGAMDFREKVVREVMTPRIDIIGVPADAGMMAVLAVAMQERHSRLPVYEGTLDRIIGIVAAKDTLPYLREDQTSTARCARDVMRPVFFVPEEKRIAPTLDELRHQRTLMAIVVDSDGGTAGLVTLEDFLEEIVGEIQDEHDTEEPPLRVLDAGTSAAGDEARAILCDAGVTVRECERFWQKSFTEAITLCDSEDEVADASMSLAALALQLFESVPQAGDRVDAGYATNRAANTSTSSNQPRCRLELEIAAMDGPRIEEVKLEKVPV